MTTAITPTKQVTVVIRGIGGIGKSTLVKAVCHEKLIKNHFPDGFIWISLTPSQCNDPTEKLRHIYCKLTNQVVAGTVLYIKELIHLFLTKHSYKLLVILDDMWNAEDAIQYIELFINCKIILTTRKTDINLEIHTKHTFDIEPMEINEAKKLLTLDIKKMQKLNPKDINSIQKLAKDLHCWPLLLNLVHGQLYFHCTVLNKCPKEAILSVHDKLSKNGLTAFDLNRQTSRDFAVKVNLDASLELLTKQENDVLQYIVCTLEGFGTYAIKESVFANSKLTQEQFDKCTENLCCHGLVKFDEIFLISSVNTISCIGMHEIIAQYITENVSLEKCFSLIQDFNQIFARLYNLMQSPLQKALNENLGYNFLAIISAMMPFYIRTMMISAKQLQMSFSTLLNVLAQETPLLIQSNAVKQFINQPQVEKLYITITQDCSYIQSLIADDRYDEAKTWFKQYNENHPLYKVYSIFVTFVKDYLLSGNEQLPPELASFVNVNTTELALSFEDCIEMILNSYMYTKLMLNTGASEEDIAKFVYIIFASI